MRFLTRKDLPVAAPPARGDSKSFQASLFWSKTVGARMYAMGEIEEKGKASGERKAWERLRKGRHGRD
jgi:hypothetical protein